MYFFLIIVTILIGFAIYRSYLNTKDIVMNHVEINPLQTSEGSFINVLQLSDLHLENISITPEQLYEQLRNEKIDLIALTGDFIDRTRSLPKLERYLKALRRLKVPHGMYAVLGNHDYVLTGVHLQKLKQTLTDYGCKLLINENETVDFNGVRVELIGIDDFSTNRSSLQQSYDGIQDGFKLILTHDPNVVLQMHKYRFDYLMSGHFHGGQIHWPKPYHLVKMGRLVRMKIVKGLHYRHGQPFYISEGLGQTGINIRVGSRPEITMHRLALHTKEAQKKKTLAG